MSLYQYHAPNQYFPKGRTHTTNEIWNYVDCVQTYTIIVSIYTYDCILFMAHDFRLSICGSTDYLFLIEFI